MSQLTCEIKNQLIEEENAYNGRSDDAWENSFVLCIKFQWSAVLIKAALEE